MYYYILETPENRAVRQAYQRLRDIVTNLGIAGEMVLASPARTPEELATMGLEKGYSTIVAVGGDAHINQVATTIVGQAVFGIVPINASPAVVDLVGSSDLREAAHFLKYRRLVTTGTVLVEPDTTIFLDAVITAPKTAKVNLVIDNRVRAFAYFQRLTINRQLELTIESSYQLAPKKFLGLFNVGNEAITSKSIFHGKNIRLVTEPELPITVSGHTIASTPIQLRLIPESLKVITKRGTVA